MTERIRLLQVVPSWVAGGAERQAAHLLLDLDRSRYEPQAVSLYGQVASDLAPMLEEGRIPLHYLGKGPGFDPRTFHRFERLVRSFRPHLIHSHLNALFYAAPSARAHGIPHVYTAQNLVPLLVPRGLGWFYRICFERWVRVVAVAGAVARDLACSFRIPHLTTIPNGIPVERYSNPRVGRAAWRQREGFAEDEVLFVSVARLAPQKNHAMLLEAFAFGPGRRPEARLLLAGTGELRGALARQAELLGLTEKVVFLGVRSDIPELLAACDVFVLASSAEANPLAVQEAMAAGLPAVCTAVGGVPELIDSGVDGFLIPPGGEARFTSTMSDLLAGAATRKAVGKRAAEKARREFDVSSVTEAYDRLYSSILGLAPAARPSVHVAARS